MLFPLFRNVQYFAAGLIFVFAFSLSASAADFLQFDLDKAITSHSLYKNYDRSKESFAGTNCEVMAVEEVAFKIKEVEQRLSLIQKNKAQFINENALLSLGDVKDDSNWRHIKEWDAKEKKLTSELEYLKGLKDSGGYPADSDFFKIISQLRKDLDQSINETKSDSSCVILNKLPYYPSELSNIEILKHISDTDFRKALNNKDEKSLLEYLNQSYVSCFLFKSVRNSVIYTKENK